MTFKKVLLIACCVQLISGCVAFTHQNVFSKKEIKALESKKIVLFGGSFNPIHQGHFETARSVYKATGADEIWFLFSKNWQKDPKKYASIDHRMAMGKILAQHYPDVPAVMTNIEEKLGTHLTAEVLEKLKHHFPKTEFIWVMGADSFASLHTWKNWGTILGSYKVIVAPRAPYKEIALNGPAAIEYKAFKIEAKDVFNAQPGVWSFLETNNHSPLSSSNIKARMKNEETDFHPFLKDVIAYIKKHHLYTN